MKVQIPFVLIPTLLYSQTEQFSVKTKFRVIFSGTFYFKTFGDKLQITYTSGVDVDQRRIK